MLPFPSLFTGYGFTICTANIDDGGRVIDPGPGGRGLDDTLGGVQSYQWGERLVDVGSQLPILELREGVALPLA